VIGSTIFTLAVVDWDAEVCARAAPAATTARAAATTNTLRIVASLLADHRPARRADIQASVKRFPYKHR
jgi:hypothetical protein